MGSLPRVLLTVIACAVALLPVQLAAVTPAAGQAAPAFSLPGADGETYALEAALERGPVVLVFYRAFW